MRSERPFAKSENDDLCGGTHRFHAGFLPIFGAQAGGSRVISGGAEIECAESWRLVPHGVVRVMGRMRLLPSVHGADR